MNLCVYTCFVYLQPFCVTLDFKLFIDSIHFLFLLYLLLWFWDFTIKNLQDFIKIYWALIKDIFLSSVRHRLPPRCCETFLVLTPPDSWLSVAVSSLGSSALDFFFNELLIC